MRRRADSQRSYAEMGVPEGHDESASLVTIRDGKVVSMRDYMTKADAPRRRVIREAYFGTWTSSCRLDLYHLDQRLQLAKIRRVPRVQGQIGSDCGGCDQQVQGSPAPRLATCGGDRSVCATVG